MTKPYRVNEKYYAPLEQVATAGTVAGLWRRSYTGVLYAIDADNIAAVKCGKTWLVSLPSVAAYWGDPPSPIEYVSMPQEMVTALQERKQNGHRGSEKGGAVDSVAQQLRRLRESLFQQEK